MRNYKGERDDSDDPAISSHLITLDLVLAQFVKIFDSSVILNTKLEIVFVNPKVLRFLDRGPRELIGKSISRIAKDTELEKGLQKKLATGFFSDFHCELKDKSSQGVKVKLSGFHLGLVSNFNEFIVLSVQNLETEFKLASQLRSWETSLDELVYRAAHDLRGPIATILGLANIAKLREDNSEVDKLFEYIHSNSELLDQRLRTFLMRVDMKARPE